MVAMLASWSASGQIAAERSAFSNLERKKWSAAKSKLDKALAKDSTNAGVLYVLAHYYAVGDNPNFQIDSANVYAHTAATSFAHANEQERERLSKIPVDSLIILNFIKKIDSAAFARAKTINTESAYAHFLANFPSSEDQARALELQYEAAFIDALKENSYEAFGYFLEHYPNTSRAREAQTRYDQLLFEAKTKDKKLVSYRRFVAEYPMSSYKAIAEQLILIVSTADGELQSYKNFVNEYPTSSAAKWARNILFHLYLEYDLSISDEPLLDSDSIQSVYDERNMYLVPFLQQNKFGFMDNTGKTVITADENELDPAYLCGALTNDVLLLEGKVVSKNNKILFKGDGHEMSDLGFGFIEVITDSCVMVLHKSGRLLASQCGLAAKMVAGKFLAVELADGWHLFTLTMVSISTKAWQEVEALNGFVGLKKDDQWLVTTPEALADVINGEQLKTSTGYDALTPWTRDLMRVAKDTDEGVIDNQLNMVIPMGEHQLTQDFYGIQIKNSEGVKFYNAISGSSEIFDDAKVQQPWVATKKVKTWKLFDVLNKEYLSGSYDSIQFAGMFAVGLTADSMVVHFKSNIATAFKRGAFDFIPSKDTTAYIWVADGEKKTLLDAKGQPLFTYVFDKITYNEQGLFVVDKKGKKGLLDFNGRLLLPIEYDAIGDIKNGTIPLLRGGKFGTYLLASKMEIKPVYDKNLKPYNDHYLIACKGLCTLITLDNKPISKFEFDNIVYWNDSATLVKKSAGWMVMNIKTQTAKIENISQYKMVLNHDDERVAIIQQNNMYGVISSKRGVVIPATFTDIVDIGTATQPLYFTEKNVEEAGLSVVIYYDANGKLIHRQALEDDEYERIYCSHN